MSDARLHVIVVRVGERGRARKVDELLRFAGQRLRPGVFEVACSADGMRVLERQIGEHLRDGDLVRVYPVCARCRTGVHLYGEGELAELPVAWIF